MNPRAEDQATIRLVVYNRRVTPISYCYDCLVVDWHGGHLRTFAGRGRGFNRGHATLLGLWEVLYSAAYWLSALLLPR
jgi:hypothetical protein